jgi:hypothetical protein
VSEHPKDTRQHHWVIDSIEEQSASIEIEAGVTINIPAAMLPPGAKSGDVVRVTIELDAAAKQDALARSAAQVKKGREMSRKLDPGGDVTL